MFEYTVFSSPFKESHIIACAVHHVTADEEEEMHSQRSKYNGNGIHAVCERIHNAVYMDIDDKKYQKPPE